MYIYAIIDPFFHPTWLYVKQHNQTKLKYFGKTTSDDPIKYQGSGTYWRYHLRKHGNDVSTTWCHLFTDKNNLINFATRFSEMNDIIESKDWANFVIETGTDGPPKGYKASLLHRLHNSQRCCLEQR